ncbi:hypothetical protein IJL65_02350 [bacterium]|nr:hypothetical protein [bacterium]
MRQVRFYPYPAVLYKIAFNKFLNGDEDVVPVKVENKVENKVEKKTEPKIEKKAEIEEKKEETAEKKSD